MTARTIGVHTWAMQLCEGDPRDAMVLCQIAYWLQTEDHGGRRTRRIVERGGEEWMWTNDATLAGELTMSEEQVRRARRALVKRGLIATRVSVIAGAKRMLLRLTLPALLTEAPPDLGDDQVANTTDPSGEHDGLRARAVPSREDGTEDGSASTSEASGSPSSLTGDATPLGVRGEPPLTNEPLRDRGSTNGHAPRERERVSSSEVAIVGPPTLTQRAQAILKPFLQERKEAGNPVGQTWIACQTVVETMLRQGVPENRIAYGLRHAPNVSTGALEYAIQKRLRAAEFAGGQEAQRQRAWETSKMLHAQLVEQEEAAR